ncbi:MAG: FAD-binding oxidoreductase [Actinobacteria bacterium]|nr:MAG: FAD-binding oxidoreductase [Actinomycetota bacterium]
MDRRGFLRASAGAIAAAAALDWEVALGAVDPRVAALRRTVRGPVLTPPNSAGLVVDMRYDAIRPLAVVQALGEGDVSRTILWARKNGVRLAARSGGHSYGGYSTTNGVVVDLRRLNGISVDMRSRTATVGAGALLFDVMTTLAARGVAIPHGSCPTVAVGGLALGGGVGFASRAWGTTSDNVLALRVVTADGRIRECGPKSNPGLYWACRGGGGGNFGVATRFRFRVHPVSNVSWFVASWPWAQAEQIVAAWQASAPHAPDGLFSICSLSGTRHVQVFGQFLGPESQLRTDLAPLQQVAGISLRTGTSTYRDAQVRWAGCLGESTAACRTPRRSSFAAKSDYFDTPLPPAGVAALRRAMERPGAGSILLDSYGGALNRPAPDATAFVHRDALFSAQYYAGGTSLHWLRAAHADMRPYASGFAYQNYIDPELADWRHAYYGTNLARLEEIKKRFDPNRFFRFPQAI